MINLPFDESVISHSLHSFGTQADFDLIGTLSRWWCRGMAGLPTGGEVMELPAGQTVTIEIACHVAWTSFSDQPETATIPGSPLDACPDNAGAYHASQVPGGPIDNSLVSGCALAIADKDDISQVTEDDFAVFSVQKDCVRHKMTPFDVPAAMPPCTGEKCICACGSNGKRPFLPFDSLRMFGFRVLVHGPHSSSFLQRLAPLTERCRLTDMGEANYYMSAFDVSKPLCDRNERSDRFC